MSNEKCLRLVPQTLTEKSANHLQDPAPLFTCDIRWDCVTCTAVCLSASHLGPVSSRRSHPTSPHKRRSEVVTCLSSIMPDTEVRCPLRPTGSSFRNTICSSGPCEGRLRLRIMGLTRLRRPPMSQRCDWSNLFYMYMFLDGQETTTVPKETTSAATTFVRLQRQKTTRAHPTN